MKIILDMNLSPSWAGFLTNAGYEATHWSDIGAFNAPDTDIMAWAKTHDCIVISCDLDFGTILAVTGGDKPSVVQIRSDNLSLLEIGDVLVNALRQCDNELKSGALLTLDVDKRRVRLLPLNS